MKKLQGIVLVVVAVFFLIGPSGCFLADSFKRDNKILLNQGKELNMSVKRVVPPFVFRSSEVNTEEFREEFPEVVGLIEWLGEPDAQEISYDRNDPEKTVVRWYFNNIIATISGEGIVLRIETFNPSIMPKPPKPAMKK